VGLRLILKNTPLGCFSRKAEKREFRALRVQFSRATFSKAELAAGGSEQLRCSTLDPCHFRESGQSFSYGFGLCLLWLCARAEGFFFFFAMFLKIDFRNI